MQEVTWLGWVNHYDVIDHHATTTTTAQIYAISKAKSSQEEWRVVWYGMVWYGTVGEKSHQSFYTWQVDDWRNKISIFQSWTDSHFISSQQQIASRFLHCMYMCSLSSRALDFPMGVCANILYKNVLCLMSKPVFFLLFSFSSCFYSIF